MKKFLRRVAPRWMLSFYHFLLAEIGALLYCYPSRNLIVIGVTGTKGKSSSAYLIAKCLESEGYKIGLSSTILFKVAEREWLNDKKMTMLGRFGLQKLLREMVKAGCKYAVIETSSEGITQFRHKGIGYDIALFTNLSPEHIESHGSYNKYKEAKAKLFKELAFGRIKGVSKTAVINIDDAEADYFLALHNKNVGFTAKGAYKARAEKIYSASNISITNNGSTFFVEGVEFHTSLLGEINVYNCLGAIAVCKTLGISLFSLKEAILKIKKVPGRMEFIEAGQNFSVIVDYAHEPASMQALMRIVRSMPHKKIIHIFGATGGGRDKSKREILGEISDANSDIIILTNDDPYNEDEEKIIKDIKKGIKRKKDSALQIIIDRGEAIKRGIMLASEGDMVLITGKGSEQVIALGDKVLPWDDRKIAREVIELIVKSEELRVKN